MKQTVTSKYEPKSKNVTWIDMSTGRPVQKNFINGMWRSTGGGDNSGSWCDCGGVGSLPDYLALCGELQWRELTDADRAKFPTDYYNLDDVIEVADIPDGKIPLIGYTAYVGFPETGFKVLSIGAIRPMGEMEAYCYEVYFVGIGNIFGVLTTDRTLLFKVDYNESVG